MQQQQPEGQVFPIQLEWLGGRSTIQQSLFSARNAQICLEDMKESERAMPVMLGKQGNQISLRTNDNMVNFIDLNDITQVHCFNKDLNYAVFEISANDGSARFEVFQAPGGESLKSIQDFLSGQDYTNRSAPSPPEEPQNGVTLPVPEPYEAQGPPQPATNGVSTPDSQMEEGYEELGRNRVDEAGAKESEGQLEGEEEVEAVDKARSSPSTTSVSSDGHPDDRNQEDTDKEESVLAEEEPRELQNQQRQQKEPKQIEVSQPQKFGKLRSLTEIIAEEQIDTKHYRDDGLLYVISNKGPKLPKGRSSSSLANEFSEGHKSRQGKSKGRVIIPDPIPCQKCLDTEAKNTASAPSSNIQIQREEPQETDLSGREGATGSLYLVSWKTKRNH
ncbi:hypothetical protein Aperf_G00000036833 [Anoplocephala perfoliata]